MYVCCDIVNPLECMETRLVNLKWCDLMGCMFDVLIRFCSSVNYLNFDMTYLDWNLSLLDGLDKSL